MTITQSLEALSTWLAENVCPKIDLKCPSDNNAEHYETVKPASFAMYLPTKEKLPPGIKAESPSVVTQLIEGTHTMTEGRTRLKLQLSFTAWNPGIHPGESSTGPRHSSAIARDGRTSGILSSERFKKSRTPNT